MNRHLARALGATALGALLLQPVITMADPPRHARNDHSVQHRGHAAHGQRGNVVHRLPPRHRLVHHHGHRYYYSHGTWYRPHGGRYVVVDPPSGLVVSFLPRFGTTVYYGGIPHYRSGPVYYVWNPRVRGYVVTDRPTHRW